MRALLSAKPDERALRIAEKVKRALERENISVCPLGECSPCAVDFIVVVGGDGTLLYTLSKASCKTPPVITVRAGRRAFLLDLEPEEFEWGLKRFLEGDYYKETHKRLDVEGIYALNEVAVLSKWRRVTRVNVVADEYKVYEGLEGDGVIVSTTIGSTAYALSAGGPLVDPRAEVLLLVPVNPIQLNARSIVLPPTSKVRVEVTRNREETIVLADGIVELEKKDLTITLNGPEVTFARFKIREFYSKLIELRSFFSKD